jgi:hypothetical protein
MKDESDPQHRNVLQLLRDNFPGKTELARDIQKLYRKIYERRLGQEDIPSPVRTDFEFDI